jgi:hypothetical protein
MPFSVHIGTMTNLRKSIGTLSFLTYYLLKNPDVMRKLRSEIDEVIGTEQPKHEHLSKLPYLTGDIYTVLIRNHAEKTFSYYA